MNAESSFAKTQVEDGLHVLHAARDGDDHVLRRQDEAILAERAIAAERPVPRAPELVAIALVPVAGRVGAVRGLPAGRGVHPGRREQLTALPLALLQIQQAQSCHRLGAQVEPIAAVRHALRARFPLQVVDPERDEQPGPQVVGGLLAGDLLHDGGQHVAGRRVVEEEGARLVIEWRREEGLASPRAPMS